MSQENVERLSGWVDAFNRRDFETIARLDDPGIEWRTSAEDPDAATHRGEAAVRRYLEGYIESFPNLQIELTECFAVGDDRVVAVNRFVGQSATGVPMDWMLTTVSTVKQGRFARVEEYFDRSEALEAVGLSE
jgi:ketosteroid isomerase-like protein